MKIEKIPEGYLLVREGGNGCELWRGYNGAESIACDAIDKLIAERDDLRTAVRHESDCVEAAKAEIKALRAKIAEMEQQEPVAWHSKQYGFVYMSRQAHQFEHGTTLYLRNGTPAWRIDGGSKVALLDMALLPHGTVFYALLGA